MPVNILIGTQWGDEGKGKLIDVLTEGVDMVVRFQGGNNAGHTVIIGDEKFVLHLVPSGIFRPGVDCIIGNGLVVDPLGLQEEMLDLVKRNVDVSVIQLSTKAQLIMPYHRMLDRFKESQKAPGKKIGTTGRGIGPAYSAKADRTGIRAVEMLDLEGLEKKFREQAAAMNKKFAAGNFEQLDIDDAWNKVRDAALYLQPYIKETVYSVNNAIKAGKNILFEGAQGGLLDIDHGTYPFVTSSNTTSGGACTGAGVSPRHIGDIYGVVKAYTTRVGEGPFPTELHDKTGEDLRAAGGEFGATTGRPRRCGWFDAVATGYSCMINGVNKLLFTKMDVLDGLPELKICTAYKVNGEVTTEMPSDSAVLETAEPVYESMPGWECDTTSARCWDDLPEKAKNYLNRLAELLEAEIAVVSVGPERDQTFPVK
jgi:adenylosuccinate synthase